MAVGAGERLSFPGAAAHAAGGADAGEGDRGALHVAQALRTVALKDTCAYCGKQGEGIKRCSICKHVWYCGADCQKAGWRRHKKTCAPPLSTDEVRAKVFAASTAGEWRGVLEWQGRTDEMMEGQPSTTCNRILLSFQAAHLAGRLSTGNNHHTLSLISLAELRIDLLGKMERFRDQGEEMCNLAGALSDTGNTQEAAGWLERARKVGEAHGFFSVECQACRGLGDQAMSEGRDEEGLGLLQNALAASRLSEREETNGFELIALHSLIDALFKTDAIELEPLVLRYREAAKAASARTGCIQCFEESNSLIFTAQLHEAREEPQEAARDVRALLDLLRENEAAVQDRLETFQSVLRLARSRLKILDPELGDEELIKSVAAELAKLCR